MWYFRDTALGDAVGAAGWLATHIDDSVLRDRDRRWVLAGFDIYLDDTYETPSALLDRLQRAMMDTQDATLDGCTDVLFREYVAEHLTSCDRKGYRAWGPLEWREE